MKVKDLLNELSKYNLEADVKIVSNSDWEFKDFKILYEKTNHCTEENCKYVYLYSIERLINELEAKRQVDTLKKIKKMA